MLFFRFFFLKIQPYKYLTKNYTSIFLRKNLHDRILKQHLSTAPKSCLSLYTHTHTRWLIANVINKEGRMHFYLIFAWCRSLIMLADEAHNVIRHGKMGQNFLTRKISNLNLIFLNRRKNGLTYDPISLFWELTQPDPNNDTHVIYEHWK